MEELLFLKGLRKVKDILDIHRGQLDTTEQFLQVLSEVVLESGYALIDVLEENNRRLDLQLRTLGVLPPLQ